jgi:hypothetical protein
MSRPIFSLVRFGHFDMLISSPAAKQIHGDIVRGRKEKRPRVPDPIAFVLRPQHA